MADQRDTTRPQSALRWRLHARIVVVILTAGVIPLTLTGVGSWIVLERTRREAVLEQQEQSVVDHSRAIEAFLTDRLRLLALLGRLHQREALCEPGALAALLAEVEESHDGAFLDLGVIDGRGRQIAYAGPHQLEGRDYSQTSWLRDVLREGRFVSDVFLGFRGSPHVVVAIQAGEPGRRWVLRATINGAQLDELVRTARLGQSGDAFLLDRQGRYQTRPRRGELMAAAGFRLPPQEAGVSQDLLFAGDGRRQLQTAAWLERPRWLLVLRQEEAEVLAPVRRALWTGVLVVLSALLALALTTAGATWYLTGRIARAEAAREALSRDLLRSARLASLGELATGLAHEINNPLAIIGAEQTYLSDLLEELDPASTPRQELLEASTRISRQVDRCGAITGKMLQFGRQRGTQPELTNLAPRLAELVALLQRQADRRGVTLRLEAEPGLPAVMVDATELEQVVINLVTNSLQATSRGGAIVVGLRREGDGVSLTVSDDGQGIAPENMDKIFQPFFTTKPVGQGTGLGLSVCYGLVTGWGGRIEASSEPGAGALITVHIPNKGRASSERGARSDR